MDQSLPHLKKSILNDENAEYLKKHVLREQVKEYIMNAILEGKFAPGDRLVETHIAKQLGVSQAPVREAFRDLERVGIAITVPYYGTFIREYNYKDLIDVYVIRAELEALAIREAISRITIEDIKRLEELLIEMHRANFLQDLKLQVRADIDFHNVIVEASGNNILINLWESIGVYLWTYLSVSVWKYKAKELVGRHEPILEAIKKRDLQEAESLIRNHFLELKKRLEDEHMADGTL
ncbi:GntR family transcriptional regulator [Thermanaeromonas sp. C210]|uniref:GntR family transcriptional regulator n=1 Tax=Thermanaeromonas sp. C210 TaxID=2731925 RepID=UPI00155CD193|nr:GntR family transcriptional regulator [Thermanaeromonas sp. C210]GFN24184.1 GntR family transcriptional regulator [Thermanaeromonas sp. C210]